MKNRNNNNKNKGVDKSAMTAAILIWLSIVGGFSALIGGLNTSSDTDNTFNSAYETYIEQEDAFEDPYDEYVDERFDDDAYVQNETDTPDEFPFATTETVTDESADAHSSTTEIASVEVVAEEETDTLENVASSDSAVTLDTIPAYSGDPYVEINNNTPFFTSDEITTEAFENYSNLDSLGRCGVAFANICQEIMPTESRGSIGSVKPTGWHTIKYDIVSGNYLYNRCHLIAYELAGENANEKNLITGTRYFNVTGMLPFENEVADYVKDTGNHVLYRVTPIFDGNNLVASGVLMEAYSVEDSGAGISFCVYCYNVQPGIGIDYATGDSWLEE